MGEWAAGASVLVDGLSEGDAAEARVCMWGQEARQLVLIAAEYVDMFLDALKTVKPWQSRPTLKADAGKSGIPIDAASSWGQASESAWKGMITLTFFTVVPPLCLERLSLAGL